MFLVTWTQLVRCVAKFYFLGSCVPDIDDRLPQGPVNKGIGTVAIGNMVPSLNQRVVVGKGFRVQARMRKYSARPVHFALKIWDCAPVSARS